MMPSELVIEYGPPTTGECEPARKNTEYEAMSRLLRTVDAVKEWAPTVQHWMLRAYLTPRPDELRLYAIARAPETCSRLREAVSDFCLALADADLDLSGRVLLDDLPDNLRAFFEPNDSLLLHWR